MSDCVHYWFIEPAQGGDSQGVCQKCKETREFHNYIVISDDAPIATSAMRIARNNGRRVLAEQRKESLEQERSALRADDYYHW